MNQYLKHKMHNFSVQHGNVIPLFSYPLYLSQNSKILSDKENEIIQKEIDNTTSNTDGNLIGNDKYLLNKLPDLKSYVEREINNYFYNILEYGETQKIYITNSWSNYNKTGTKNHIHKHPNSIVSGVFYVQGESAPIEFYNDDYRYLLNLNVKQPNWYNTNRVWYGLVKNNLYLFPSTLTHGVQVNNSKTTRISIAFNTFIKGPTGNDLASTRVEI